VRTGIVWGRRRVLRWAVLIGLAVLGPAGALLAWRPWRGPPGPTGIALHWRLAQEALEAQDFALAREHLGHCVESCPAHAETRFLLARAARRADDLESAETHLKVAEAMQWAPEEVALERLLTQAQLGDLGRAEAPLLERLEEGPVAEELILEALIKGYLAAYRLPEAAHLATRWLGQRPGRWQPWLYRGRAHYLNGAFGRAAADYRRALEALPWHRQGRLWYAGALLLDGRFRDALPAFEKYVGDYPDDPAGLLGLADCHLMLKQRTEAERFLDRLLRQQPEHGAGLLLRARLELDRDDPKEALVWLKKAEAAAPHEVDIVQGLIQAYRQLGRPDEAKRYQARLEELRKSNRRLDALRTQILSSPKEIGPRQEAAALCLRLGRPREALDWLLGALTLDPNNRPTHEALAQCFEQLGDKNLAEYHRRRSQSNDKLTR
jgi:tetratricopeptide (TPR) repeat protein